jgi:glycosyltransferase involved in cell wall biosynthesis
VRPYKGLDDLIEALADVPGATLDVVGRFHQPVSRYRRLALRHGVISRVRFHDGYVPDERLRDTFAAADVVVTPYRQASQSGVVHLAYSFGRPVVATAVGGLAESVLDGVSGVLAPRRDPAALAAALRRALAAPDGFFDDGIRRVVAARTWNSYARLVLAAALDEGGRAEA